MAEISPIQGAFDPKNDPDKRDLKKIGTPEKFKETYRVQAVDSTDTESKGKKKKKQQPGEDENPNEGLVTPLKPITGGSLEDSPFAVQAPSKKVTLPSKVDEGHLGAGVGRSYSPSGPESPEAGNQTQDNFPSAQPQPQVQGGQPPQAPSAGPASPPPAPNIPNVGMDFSGEESYDEDNLPPPPSQQNYTTTAQTQTSTTNTSQNTPATPGMSPIEPASHVPSTKKDVEKGKIPAMPYIEKTEALKPEKSEEQKIISPSTVLPTPPTPKKEEEVIRRSDAMPEGNVQSVSSLSSESTGGDKKKDKEQNKEKDEGSATVSEINPSMQVPHLADVAPAAQPLPVYTTFSPAVLEMYEKMISTISVLQESSGERKTTITLSSPNFSSSAFYGAEIVIEEDLHLAPGQYNIKLIGSPEAVSLFQAKSDDLLAAFKTGGYNFKVQRLETEIQSTDKPLFKRKEGVSKDSGSEQGPPQ